MIYLKVTPREGISFEEFVLECHRNSVLQQFDIAIIQERHLYDREKIKEILFEKGQTSILKEEVLLEHIVAKGTPQNIIIDIIQKYLDKLSPDQEIIIVDPYFFPNKYPANYSTFVSDILRKYLSVINSLKIVTNSGFNAIIKAQILSDLQSVKPSLSVTHTQSDDYHDRFWISNNREKGVLIGSSLNGLGNKYALIDRLNTSDVRRIVQELTTARLV